MRPSGFLSGHYRSANAISFVKSFLVNRGMQFVSLFPFLPTNLPPGSSLFFFIFISFEMKNAIRQLATDIFPDSSGFLPLCWLASSSPLLHSFFFQPPSFPSLEWLSGWRDDGFAGILEVLYCWFTSGIFKSSLFFPSLLA